MTETGGKIVEVLESLKNFLLEKNKRYGNSALEPAGIFTSFISECASDQAEISLLARLDDKLNRIRYSGQMRKNDIVDLIGYLVLLSVKHGWVNFDDLID